ncbi:MAG: outer membrane protein assembly factor BamD [bacterium]|nr:outer membrane protein assembly factor BamD [bacterium]
MHFRQIKFIRRPWCLLLCSMCAGLLFAADDPAVIGARDIFRQGLTAYKQQNYKLALKLLRTMQEQYPASPYTVRGLEYTAQCENQLGDPYAAFEAYQKIWDDHKDFAKLPSITRNQMMIGNYYLNVKQYKEAIEIYRKILDNAPHSDVAAAAQYSLAQAHIGDDDYEPAKSELEKLMKNYPTSQLVDDAAFQVGYIEYLQSADAAYDQQPTANAIAAFRRFVSNFPSSPKVAEAQRYIRELRGRRADSLLKQADFYENIRATKSAEIVYREVIEQYPDTSYADQARRQLNTLSGTPPSAADAARDSSQAQALRSNAGAARTLDTPTPSASASATKPAAAAAVQRQASAERIAQLQQDPQTRAQLRDQMKSAYVNELKDTRATRAAWQKNRLTMLERSRQKADALLSTAQPGSAPTAPDATPPAAAPAARAASRTAAVADALAPPRTAAAAAPAAARAAHTAAAAGAAAPRTAASAAPAMRTAAAAAPRTAPKPLTGLSLSDVVPGAEAEPAATPSDAAGDADKLLEGMGFDSQEIAEATDPAAAPAPTGKAGRSAKADALAAPVHTATRGASQLAMAGAPPTPATEPDAETETLSAADMQVPTETVDEQHVDEQHVDEQHVDEQHVDEQRVDEQRVDEQAHAADVYQNIGVARQQTDEGKATVRRLDVDGRVRRAKLDDENQTISTNTTYNTDALMREYAGMYYLFMRGDALMEQGSPSEAKKYYSDALDRLLALKEKAPDWQSEIVDFRIDHCRKQLRTIP